MRNTRKILFALLVLITLMVSMFAVTASAAAGQTWTVAGSKALCGTDWDVNNKNNDMTYDSATDSYVKVFTNVKAGNYEIKCAQNHSWDTSYGNGSANKSVKVAKDGSTVTVTLKGTTVTVTVEAPACDHKYAVTGGTVTCLTAGTRTWTCSVCNDSYTENLTALGHHYDANGKCERCDETTTLVRVYVDNAAKWADVYCYTWDTNPYVAWPGEKMAKDEATGYYYYDIPTIFVNVIFNNGEGTQTDDLKTPTGKAVVYNNSTKAWGELPHTHSYEAVVTAPTCTAGGYTTYTCDCGDTYTADETATVAHSFENGTCSVCNAPDPDYVAPETPDEEECEHEFEENVFWHTELVQATCCAPGVAVFECIYCDYYYTEETPVDPEAHAFWGDEEIITEANCATKTNGLKKVACANGCGEFDEVEISYYEVHNWDVQKESYATCTEAGEYYAVCTLCGEVDEYTNDANGHYNWYLNCGETGECMECGEEFFKDHDWYVTCTEAAFCANCFAEGAAAPGHTWVDATCTDPKTCSVCEETEGEALGHLYYYNVCLTCYGPNPYFENNYATVGENKLVCNEYHLVDTEGHGFPYQFTLMTIPADGIYAFTTPNFLSITVFTTAVTADNLADFEVGGPGWAAYDTDGIVELKAGTYYIGYIFAAGVGEYTMNISLHEHTFEEGKCVCGAEDPDYVAPEQPAPEQPAPEQPAPEVELTLVEQIMKTLSELIAKITAWFKSFVAGLKM